ncbi:MAG: 4a-hydroxytetrahydrobiopterin dehydratase [Bdellovibrionales bacterium]
MIERLSDPQIEKELQNLSGWQRHETKHAIQKSFKFNNFASTWAFMSHIALIAEKMDHHPEWNNIYNRLDIILTTHDANGISTRDVKMAKSIDKIRQ